MLMQNGALYFYPHERLEALSLQLKYIERVNRIVSGIKLIDTRLDDLERYLRLECREEAHTNIQSAVDRLYDWRLHQIQELYKPPHYA